jgi:hypothetical protein
MTLSDHLDEIERALLVNSIVSEFTVTRRWVQSDAGYIRLRAVLTNGDLLECAEYLELNEGRIVLQDYRHQWMTSDYQLRLRWDCTPHHPEISTHPHHCHVGSERVVEPSAPMTITDVLDLIQAELPDQ